MLRCGIYCAILAACWHVGGASLSAQATLGAPVYNAPGPAPVAWSPPGTNGNPLPINLPTALKLVNARAMDIAIATQRIQQANAQFDQAKYAWLPTITLGADYMRHDGRFQEAGGGTGALYTGAPSVTCADTAAVSANQIAAKSAQ